MEQNINRYSVEITPITNDGTKLYRYSTDYIFPRGSEEDVARVLSNMFGSVLERAESDCQKLARFLETERWLNENEGEIHEIKGRLGIADK